MLYNAFMTHISRYYYMHYSVRLTENTTNPSFSFLLQLGMVSLSINQTIFSPGTTGIPVTGSSSIITC